MADTASTPAGSLGSKGCTGGGESALPLCGRDLGENVRGRPGRECPAVGSLLYHRGSSQRRKMLSDLYFSHLACPREGDGHVSDPVRAGFCDSCFGIRIEPRGQGAADPPK